MSPSSRDDRGARRPVDRPAKPGRDDDRTPSARPQERPQAGARRTISSTRTPPASSETSAPRRSWAAEGGLPKWVSEALARSTSKPKLEAATAHLENAAKAFAAGRHGKAKQEAELAKQLAPRDATIRELIALSSYRLGHWDDALRELRAFRRICGEALHMPIEMDVLRALGRTEDIEEVWTQFRGLDADRATIDEAKVVYASHLLDQGQAHKAWNLISPPRITADPGESEMRVWYVAARVAHELGDAKTARRLREAIQAADPAFPGLDELDRLID